MQTWETMADQRQNHGYQPSNFHCGRWWQVGSQWWGIGSFGWPFSTKRVLWWMTSWEKSFSQGLHLGHVEQKILSRVELVLTKVSIDFRLYLLDYSISMELFLKWFHLYVEYRFSQPLLFSIMPGSCKHEKPKNSSSYIPWTIPQQTITMPSLAILLSSW